MPQRWPNPSYRHSTSSQARLNSYASQNGGDSHGCSYTPGFHRCPLVSTCRVLQRGRSVRCSKRREVASIERARVAASWDSGRWPVVWSRHAGYRGIASWQPDEPKRAGAI